MPQLDQGIVDQHEQKYVPSCIPACVELVLKLLGKVPQDFYDEQEAWKNKTVGSFGNYNGKTVHGVTFRHLFHEHERSSSFPIEALFRKVDEELAAGRYVIISLVSPGGWHMYVIHEKRVQEYVAVSKDRTRTIEEATVRAAVLKMGGTDILVYDPV